MSKNIILSFISRVFMNSFTEFLFNITDTMFKNNSQTESGRCISNEMDSSVDETKRKETEKHTFRKCFQSNHEKCYSFKLSLANLVLKLLFLR